MPVAQARVWRGVLILSTATNFVSYCDRVCISIAAPRIKQEFALSAAQMGWVFGAFSLAYALFLTPWGMLADRANPRRMIAAIALAWSLFTGGTAAAWSFASMLVIRFLFGTAESGLNPAVVKVVAQKIAGARRSTAFGIFLGGGRLGGTLAPPLAGFLVLRFGWRAMFTTFASMGLVTSALWFLSRDRNPDERPTQDEAAMAETSGAHWREIFSSTRILLLMGVSLAYTAMWQFYPTWFPTYLIEKRGFTLGESSWYAGLPFLFGLAATWGGGWVADILAGRLGRLRGRMWLGVGSLVLSAALLAAGMFWPERKAAAILIALAAGAGDTILGMCWATAVEIGGKMAGTVSGMMNAASNAGAFLSPVLMGWVVSRSGQWNAALALALVANLIGALLWAMLHWTREVRVR